MCPSVDLIFYPEVHYFDFIFTFTSEPLSLTLLKRKYSDARKASPTALEPLSANCAVEYVAPPSALLKGALI